MLLKSLRERAPWIYRAFISSSLKSSSHLYNIPLLESRSLVLFSTLRRSKSGANVTLFDYLVNRQQFSPESASKVPSSSTTYLKKPQNADSVINFLKESGFAKTQIENVVQKVPKVLSSKLERIKPKVKILQEMGFDSNDAAEIISADPWILRSADFQLKSILVLKSVMGSNAAVCRLLKLSRWFLRQDLERAMLPNIEYLNSCGISSSQIVKYISSFPRFFLAKTERIRGFVKRVDEMGVDRKSKMFLLAIRAVGSMTREKWELKLKLLRELGFSEDDILFMFRRAPPAFGVSERKIKEVIELLLSVENLDISYIARNPELLIYSVKQRLKPRLRVLEVLERKNLLRKKPKLSTFFKLTNAQFEAQYVNPYLDELGDLYLCSHAS